MNDLNTAIFDTLADPEKSKAASDAVNDWTRAQMQGAKLKFTGMPRRSIWHLICPPVSLLRVADMERWGWPYLPRDIVEMDGERLVVHAFDRGRLFYELVEARLQAEDYADRLRRRVVGKREWKSEQHCTRSMRRSQRQVPADDISYEIKDAGFCQIMNELAGQIQMIGLRNGY